VRAVDRRALGLVRRAARIVLVGAAPIRMPLGSHFTSPHRTQPAGSVCARTTLPWHTPRTETHGHGPARPRRAGQTRRCAWDECRWSARSLRMHVPRDRESASISAQHVRLASLLLPPAGSSAGLKGERPTAVVADDAHGAVPRAVVDEARNCNWCCAVARTGGIRHEIGLPGHVLRSPAVLLTIDVVARGTSRWALGSMRMANAWSTT